MKNSNIYGAEGLIIHGNKIVLGMQTSKRWYDLENGKKASIIKTIGGSVEKQDSNTRNTLIREILEEISGISLEQIKVSSNPIFKKEVQMKEINPYEKESNLNMTADFYIVEVPNNIVLKPNDLPALLEIPLYQFNKLPLSSNLQLEELKEYTIKKDENIDLPDNFALMIPVEIKECIEKYIKQKKIKENIAFDFDGVIANTTQKKIDWLKKRNINLVNVDKTSFYDELKKYMTIDQIDDIYFKMSREIFTERVLLETEEINGALNSIHKLSKKYNIFIITARTESLILHLKKWLEKNNIQKDIFKVLSSTSDTKQNICLKYNINFLCDDDSRHLIDNKIRTRVLFNSNNNSKNINDNIIQVNSWKELEKLLVF